MSETHPGSFTSFEGHRRIASGTLQTNALAVKKLRDSHSTGPVLTFNDETGRPVDLDTRGTDEEVRARFDLASEAAKASGQSQTPEAATPRGPGRPKLGVVAREVTLLPRHWEWLATQPGGASVALRKLVEAARRTSGERDTLRQAQERAYHFMLAVGGDLPGFEEATRALFANQPLRLRDLLTAWPPDVADHALRLALGGER